MGKFKIQRSFRNLVGGMENQVLSGYQVYRVDIAVADTRESPKIIQAEGTDFIVPLIQPTLDADWGFSIALNEGYKSNDWIRYTDFHIPTIRNIPFWQIAFAFDDTEHALHPLSQLVFRVETNPRIVTALMGGF